MHTRVSSRLALILVLFHYQTASIWSSLSWLKNHSMSRYINTNDDETNSDTTSDQSLLKTKLMLRQQHQQISSPSRCLNLCQNDQYCKSGQCILTECSDTVACYKYCMLCNSQMNCYQSGEFCSYGSSGGSGVSGNSGAASSASGSGGGGQSQSAPRVSSILNSSHANPTSQQSLHSLLLLVFIVFLFNRFFSIRM